MVEWIDILLSDILMDKGYIRGPFGSALKRGDMKEDGIPVYEQQHAIYNGRDFRYYIDKQKFNEMKRFQVKKDDLIISCSGTVGKVSIIKDDDPKGIISQALLLLRADTNKVLPLYLKYFFSSREGYNAIVSRSSGSVQVNIAKRSVIEQIPLKLPQLKTQRKIVGVLSSIDEKIEENERINNNLEQQVTTVFYNMFGKYEQNSNTHKPLSTIAKFKYGTMPKKDKLGTGHYHAFSGYQIVGTYPEVMFENPQLIIVARGVGGCGDVKYTPANCYLTNLSIAIITEKTMHDDYLYHYLRLHDTKIMNTGSAQPQITVATLEKFEIPIPPEEEMIRFSDFVQPFKQQYRNNQDENKLLSKLRDTLLSKLMSGELDVSDIDI